MNKEYFRLGIGVSVIIIHFLCLLIILSFKGDFLDFAERISTALLFMPVTAAYVCAIIKSAIERSHEKAIYSYVNLNYASIVSLFTLCTLGGLLWCVVSLEGALESDKQVILLFETAFGGGFGLIAADLFGKSENISEE